MTSSPNQKTDIATDRLESHPVVRKSNDEIGYRVRAGHLSLLSRKIFNILIWHAQELRNQEDADGRWTISVAKLIKDAKFNSRDYDLLRTSLNELQDVRVIRPAKGGGITSEVLIPSFTLDNVIHEGNEHLERGQKRRGGELRLWFMLPPELKRQLLSPDQYTRLPIPIMAALKTVPGLALYEVCRRYATNPGGVTNRDTWQNWWRILTGSILDVEPPEYKYAKRDVFKRAVEEVVAITDVVVELIEYKVGKSVRDVQFSVKLKQQGRLDFGPAPIESVLLTKLVALGLTISNAESLSARYSEEDLTATLSLVEERIAHPTMPPIESPAAYFRQALRDKYANGKRQLTERKAAEKAARDAKLKCKVEEGKLVNAVEQAKRDAVLDAFMALPEVERLNQLEIFVTERLKGPSLKAYRTQGIQHPMVKGALTGWLLSRQDAPKLL